MRVLWMHRDTAVAKLRYMTAGPRHSFELNGLARCDGAACRIAAGGIGAVMPRLEPFGSIRVLPGGKTTCVGRNQLF